MTPNRGLALGIALAGGLLGGPLYAQTVVEWRAPSGCPGYDHVMASVEDLAPGTLAEEEPSSHFVAEVTGLPNGRWRLEIRRTQGGVVAMRQLEGDSCEAVAEAAAAAIALALRPLDTQDELWSLPAEATPPPTQQHAAERPPAPIPDDSASAATDPDADHPARDRSRVKPPAFASALGGTDLATFPAAAGTAELGLGLGVARGIVVQPYGVMVPTQRYRMDAATEAKFSLYVGGLRLCAQSVEGRIGANVCAGVEGGSVVAKGDGDQVTATRRSLLWIAPTAALGVSWPLSKRVRLAGQGALLVPLVRHQFQIDPDPAPIHELPHVSGRLLVGAEIRLW